MQVGRQDDGKLFSHRGTVTGRARAMRRRRGRRRRQVGGRGTDLLAVLGDDGRDAARHEDQLTHDGADFVGVGRILLER